MFECKDETENANGGGHPPWPPSKGEHDFRVGVSYEIKEREENIGHGENEKGPPWGI